MANFLLIGAIIAILCSHIKGSFEDKFSKSDCPESHFKTSQDGQIWYLSLDNKAGTVKSPYNDIRYEYFLIPIVKCRYEKHIILYSIT